MIFENICRTCCSEGELQSLFTTDNSFANILTDLIDMEIIENDNYPQNICTLCLEKLIIAYNFKRQCQDAHSKFDEYLKYNQTNDSNESLEDSKQENLFLIHIENDDENWEEENTSITADILKEEPPPDRIKPKHRSKCKICNKSITKLYEHMRLHTKEKPYKCEYCSMEFSIRSNYKRHLKIHINDRRHVCEICDRRFIVRYALAAHMSTHAATIEEKFKCELCEKSFKAKTKLKLHVCELHCNETAKKHSDDEKSTYLCNYCGKVFIRKINLEQHLRIHTGERPYKCRFCVKSFRNSITLSNHESTHTGDRPYKCTICDQSFRQSAHLRQHKWRHTGIKPYLCTLCNKQFTASGSLTIHMRTHTGETPYVCTICEKGFYDSSSMKKHMKRHLFDNINKH